jgi:hypothetical protein
MKGRIEMEANTELNENEIRLFVQKNSDYYINKWGSVSNPQKYARWNWSAFWAGMFWMGYRKMYKTLLVFLILFLIIDLIQLYFHLELDRVVNSSLSLMFGLLGNAFYYKYMKERIKKVKAENNTENLDSILSELGGTSWAGVGIAFLLLCGYIGITFLMTYVIAPSKF